MNNLLSVQCCLSCLTSDDDDDDDSTVFLSFAGATLAGVERSAWLNCINTCIRAVISPSVAAEKAIPFHVDRRADHWRNFITPRTMVTPQAITTCMIISGGPKKTSTNYNVSKPVPSRPEKPSINYNVSKPEPSRAGPEGAWIHNRFAPAAFA